MIQDMPSLVSRLTASLASSTLFTMAGVESSLLPSLVSWRRIIERQRSDRRLRSCNRNKTVQKHFNGKLNHSLQIVLLTLLMHFAIYVLCMFVTPLQKKGRTDLDETLCVDSRISEIKYRLLFILISRGDCDKISKLQPLRICQGCF